MRVFLSAYSGFTLAIPMEVVASMILYDQKTEKTIQYDQKSRSTCVSLPQLFNLRDESVRHGVVLREWNSKENKVVLLTAEVKRDIEIPDEEFHPIPKTLGAMRFSAMFSGIKFSDNHPIILLNVDQLPQIIQKVQQQAIDEKNNPPEQPAPAVTSKPSPIIPNKVIEEPPTSPAEISEPSPPTPDEVIEEPAEASESSSLMLDDVVEVYDVFDKPPTGPAEISEPSPPTSDEVIEISAETSDISSLTLDEDTEICDVVDESPISFSEVSADSSFTLEEDIEICEVIDDIVKSDVSRLAHP